MAILFFSFNCFSLFFWRFFLWFFFSLFFSVPAFFFQMLFYLYIVCQIFLYISLFLQKPTTNSPFPPKKSFNSNKSSFSALPYSSLYENKQIYKSKKGGMLSQVFILYIKHFSLKPIKKILYGKFEINFKKR